MAFRLRFLLRQISDPVFETSDSKRLPVKYSSQSDFESLDFDIDWPRGLASLVLTKRNAASGNEIGNRIACPDDAGHRDVTSCETREVWMVDKV